MPLPSDEMTVQRPAWGSVLRIAAPILKVGAIGFGGPLAAISLMRVEVVERRRLVSPERFLEGLAAVKLLPGPISTLLAVFLGTQVAGVVGGVVCGVAYVLPAFLLLLLIAVLRDYLGPGLINSFYFQLPMESIQVAVVAIVLVTCWKLFRESQKRVYAGRPRPTVATAIALLAGFAAWKNLPELAILAVAGALGWGSLTRSVRRDRLRVDPFTVFMIFFLASLTVFGTGYMVLPHLQRVLVEERHWLEPSAFLEAIAWGNLTPGPIVIASTYMGYVMDGFRGAVFATAGIFAAPILLMSALAPVLRRVLGKPWVEGLLLGVLPAVSATIALGILGLSKGIPPVPVNLGWGVAALVLALRGMAVLRLFGIAVVIGLARAVLLGT
jgi:chromate transporter